jgi:hypothetical protein
MKYMLLITEDEKRFETMSEADLGRLMAEYGAFHEKVEKSGAFLGAHRLRPTATATTVRVREGKTLTTDGPFAETKEQFGGYYLIDVENLDEAIRWAAEIPSARAGAVEIRPVWED